ncbi:TPM domain-containing protein [Methyloferula stellata]|uniref:TPM domain-containing protein n=1 Tax=Methyloferula stellata TaxID=876270 RepID=UPI00037D74CF|nr:TPM domain-containing protein [Methyloferula stellata]
MIPIPQRAAERRPPVVTDRHAPPRWLILAILALVGFCGLSLAQNFPALTGRIVDQANVIPPQTRTAIETKLKDLEQKSGIQLVVATVASLDGQEIEPYANELFRTWKLGEKTKNNGVLLLVAPKEHRTRIEVGYGLEGTLTDLLSKVIITNAMIPRFKTGDYGAGIERGVDDIITVLTTDSSEWEKRPELRAVKQGQTDQYTPLIALIVIVIIVILILRSSHRSDILSFIAGMLLSGGSGGGGGGGGWSGGGSDDSFSGGGGSSGGGGASGDW